MKSLLTNIILFVFFFHTLGESFAWAKAEKSLNLGEAVSNCPACSSYYLYSEGMGGGGLSKLQAAGVGAVIDVALAPSPKPSRSTPAVPEGMVCTGGSTTEAAKGPVYPLIGPYCEASRMGKGSEKENAKVASAYSTAGAACMGFAAMCLGSLILQPFLAPFFNFACVGVGAGAAVVDTQASLKLQKEGADTLQSLQTAIGGAAVSVGSGTFTAAYQMQGFDGNIFTCLTPAVTGLLYLAIAQVRQENGKKQAKTSQQNCNVVQQLMGRFDEKVASTVPTCSPVPVANYGTAPSSRPTGSAAAGVDGVATSGKGTGSTFNGSTPVDENYFGESMMQAAASGYGGELIKKDSKKWGQAVGKLSQALQYNLPQVEARLTAGESPFTIAGEAVAALKLPDAKTQPLLATLKKFSELSAQGKLLDPGVFQQSAAIVVPEANKKSVASPSAKPRPRWSPRRRAGQHTEADEGVQEFEFSRRSPLRKSEDIWHAEWTGSIFELVSSVVQETSSRIEPAEWLGAENRTLVGLPPLPPGANEVPGIQRDKPYTLQELKEMNRKKDNPILPEDVRKELPFQEPDQEVK